MPRMSQRPRMTPPRFQPRFQPPRFQPRFQHVLSAALQVLPALYADRAAAAASPGSQRLENNNDSSSLGYLLGQSTLYQSHQPNQ